MNLTDLKAFFIKMGCDYTADEMGHLTVSLGEEAGAEYGATYRAVMVPDTNGIYALAFFATGRMKSGARNQLCRQLNETIRAYNLKADHTRQRLRLEGIFREKSLWSDIGAFVDQINVIVPLLRHVQEGGTCSQRLIDLALSPTTTMAQA